MSEDPTHLLAAAFDHAATSLSFSDVNGRIVQANQAFWNLFGYEVGTPLDVGMISRATDLDWTLSYLTRLITGDLDVFRTVKNFVRSDGTEFDGHIAIRAIRVDGVCTGLIASIDQVDVRPMFDNARFRKLFEHAAGSVSLIGSDGIVVETSGRYRWTLGYPPEFWENRTIFDITVAEDLPLLEDLRDQFLSKPEYPASMDIRVHSASRNIETLSVTALNMLHDPDLNGIVVSTRNVTAERQMADSLERLRDKAVAEAEQRSYLLATVIHELRNPLHEMSGLVELLASDASLAESHRMLAGFVLRQLIRLTSVTDDLLDTSQSEVGQPVVRVGPVVLRNLIDDVMQVAKSAAEGRIAVAYQVADDIPHLVTIDQVRLQQILSNLVGNAVKFTEVGSVHLDASVVDGKMLHFEVRDTGIGIPPDQINLIFEPFSTAITGGDHRGAGLGLAVVRRLVEAHGGSVSTQSVFGQGSVFTIEIPLVEVRAELPVASTHVAETANRYRILVVEDTAVNQELARHQLEQLGMDYMIAESAEIGLDHLESSSFDAILMGHQLPGMNGRDATREIRRRGLLTPIVGLTASSIAADVRGCLDAGMNAFLAQPVGLEQLGTTLRQVLTRGDSAAPALTSSLTPTSTLTVDRVAVDESVLDELVAELRDRTIVENLVTTFLSELDARGADIAIGDHEKAARQAHTLKSSAKLLGALHLAELCAAAETDGSVRDALSAAAIAARVGLREWLIAVPKHPGTGMTYQVK